MVVNITVNKRHFYLCSKKESRPWKDKKEGGGASDKNDNAFRSNRTHNSNNKSIDTPPFFTGGYKYKY